MEREHIHRKKLIKAVMAAAIEKGSLSNRGDVCCFSPLYSDFGKAFNRKEVIR